MIEWEHVDKILADPAGVVKPGPGKFEACEDLRLAKALYELSHDKSNVDDELGSIDEGMWIGLMDRHVAWEDPQGFFEYETFDTHEEARHAFLGH